MKGFTLIEFIIFILIAAILGLALVAVFTDTQGNAYEKTLESVTASLTSAAAHNYQRARAGDPAAVSVSNCADVANALPNGMQVPSGYSITSQPVAAGVQATCTVVAPNSTTATFQVVGTS